MASPPSRLLAIATAIATTGAWIAVSPIVDGSMDVFELDGTSGAKGKDILSIPVPAGETLQAGSFACGRCFCLILTSNLAKKTSYLYNMSFCIVPEPVLQSRLPLPGLAYNLHSGEGEGDGGNAYSILIDHTVTPQTYHVVQVVANTHNRRIDISKYVDQYAGNVYPGGTAFCAETMTMYVAIQTADQQQDTLLTLDLGKNVVVSNISIADRALASHFADCSKQAVGGFTEVTKGGVSTVQVGMLDATGAFNVIDSLALPKGSTMALSGVGDFLHMQKWAASAYGAILYSTPFALPGVVFTSTAKTSGPATFVPLSVVAASISVEY